ncbi:MAG: PAS domain S-box protein, partial [Blastocatellia bacterium]|nr:PAS domain S-box protein [Blastocatellia bacterium]
MTKKKDELISVLLIEDDEDDYFLTKCIFDDFKDNGYKLEWTTDVSEALVAMKSGKHDIYLLDYRLGEYDGLQILRDAIAGGCTAPILLLTGQTDKEVDFEAMQAGAADYLVKGQFEAPLLERVIRYSIQHSRSLERMQASEKRFRSVIQSASDAIFLVNHLGNIILWNNAAEKIFGYSEKEILGKSAIALMGEKYAQKATELGAQQTLKYFIAPLSRQIIQAIGRRKDGSEFPLEMSGSVWETNEGLFYTAIIRDISERKRYQQQLADGDRQRAVLARHFSPNMVDELMRTGGKLDTVRTQTI